MIFVSCWLPELLRSLIKSHLQSCARDLKQHLHFLLLRTLVCSAARNVDLPSLKSNFQHPAGFLVFWTGKKKIHLNGGECGGNRFSTLQEC